jgi:hypothetical protein
MILNPTIPKEINMDILKMCLSLIVAVAIVLPTSMAFAQETTVIENKDKVTIPAGTAWDSSVRAGEVCDFDLKIKYDQRFEITAFETYEVYHIVVRDVFKNLATGKKFVDTADYYIRFDYATGEAYHTGTFWLTESYGDIVVLDQGAFYQNWYDSEWITVYDLVGPDHDVNSVPFGTWSYCDWAAGDFPRAPDGDDDDGDGCDLDRRSNVSSGQMTGIYLEKAKSRIGAHGYLLR